MKIMAQILFYPGQSLYVPLVPPEFNFDREVLEEAFRQGAKALIL